MDATIPVDGGNAELEQRRIDLAKRAYTTRHVDLDAATHLMTGVEPRNGDLVLATVSEVGHHTKIELPEGRRAALFPGDEVIVAYGNRYAPDQFEATIPADLGPCELVAAGGVAARVLSAHGRMNPATCLEPVGLLTDGLGRRMGLHLGVPAQVQPLRPENRPLTIAVVGSCMNAGKTTTAAHLARGLRLAGLQVGAAKTTGTGAGGDVWLLTDAGAYPVYDFTLAGLPSTYQAGADVVRDIFTSLHDRLTVDGCDAVVLEIADGVYQQETSALISDPVFADRVDAVIFASSDALGAVAGLSWLQERGIAPVALSGVLSSSPLATREAEAVTGFEVWGLQQLADPQFATDLVTRLRDGRAPVPVSAPDPRVEREFAHRSQQDAGDQPAHAV